MDGREREKSCELGEIIAYSKLADAVVLLARLEMARGMPNGGGYAQALDDITQRISKMLEELRAK